MALFSSATTQILARIIRDAVGGPEQTLAFAWRELFNPLGMRNVTLEFDGVGTLQGSTYMLASARDWARFGLLYLNDGVVGGETHPARGLGGFFGRRHARHRLWRRLLDQSQRASQRAKGRVQLGIPRDAFFASGDLGQRIVIMPSQQLVDRPPRRQRRSDRRYQRARTAGEGSDRGDAVTVIAGRCASMIRELSRCRGLDCFGYPAMTNYATAPPHTARPFPARAHRPDGRGCVRETPSPWDGPAPARRAPRRPPAESSSGCRRR